MDPAQTLYEQGLERYQNGEPPAELIPLFKEICDRAPKNSAGWSSLAWLYLLTDQPQRALKAAQKGVKIDKVAPQARVNLILAMLDTGTKGVREQVDIARDMLGLDEEIRADVEENLRDGLQRKPNWKSLRRLCDWLDVS